MVRIPIEVNQKPTTRKTAQDGEGIETKKSRPRQKKQKDLRFEVLFYGILSWFSLDGFLPGNA